MTTTTTGRAAHGRDRALALANGRRLEIRQLREQVSAGEVTLAELMQDPPAAIEHWACIDVVRLKWTRRTNTSLEKLGRLAVRDGINLLLPMSRASKETRAWIAAHVTWRVYPQVNGDEQRVRVSVGAPRNHRRRVPIEPLQHAFFESGLSYSEVARRMGWVKHRGHRQSGDTSRLQRTLGLRRDTRLKSLEPKSDIDLSVALRIADALGLDPHTIDGSAQLATEEQRPSTANGACPECGERETWTDSGAQERCEGCWAIVRAEAA